MHGTDYILKQRKCIKFLYPFYVCQTRIAIFQQYFSFLFFFHTDEFPQIEKFTMHVPKKMQ